MKQRESAFVLNAAQIEYALDHNYRQYLTGRLQYPQKELICLDDDIEVGMSRYDCFTADKPHLHTQATEHVYVLEGEVRIRLMDSVGQEYRLKAGDFFCYVRELHTLPKMIKAPAYFLLKPLVVMISKW